MPEWLEVLLPLVGGGVIGYFGHLFQAKTATKDNTLNLKDARRAEALGHLRWASELAVSSDEGKRRLGVDQLQALSSDPSLEPADLRRVYVAITSALHQPLLEIAQDKDPEVRWTAPEAEEER